MSEISNIQIEDLNLGLKDNVARDSIIDVENISNKNSVDLEERGVNVLNYGAIGDGESDDSIAFQQALDNHNLVFIPAGTYKVKDVIINNFTTKKLFGEEGTILSPFKRFTGANIPNQMFNVTNGNRIEFTNIEFASDNLTELESSPSFYTKSVIACNNVGETHFYNCNIHDFYCDVAPLYYEGWTDREGLFLTICDGDLYFKNNTLIELYGEEWIWWHYKNRSFEDGNVFFNDNTLGSSTPRNGSITNILGGKVEFKKNIVYDYNYIGSVLNIMSDNIEIVENKFYNCDCGHIVDTTETSRVKNTYLLVKDNVVDCKDATYFIKCNAQNVDILNNVVNVYALCHVAFSQVDTDFLYSNLNTHDYGIVNFKNNILTRSDYNPKPNTEYNKIGAIMVEMGGGSNFNNSVKKIIIDNNSFNSTILDTTSIPIRVLGLIDETIISNNIFQYSGRFNLSTKNGYIQKTGNAIGLESRTEKMSIVNNIYRHHTDTSLPELLFHSPYQVPYLSLNMVLNTNLATSEPIDLFLGTNTNTEIVDFNTNFVF